MNSDPHIVAPREFESEFVHASRSLAMPTIKVSVVQACTAAYGSSDSLALTIAKLDRFTALAKEKDGSQLAVFPEALYVLIPSVNHSDRQI